MTRFAFAAVLMLAFQAAPATAGLFGCHDEPSCCAPQGCAPTCSAPVYCEPTCGVPSCDNGCGPVYCDGYCAPKKECFVKRCFGKMMDMERRKNACLFGGLFSKKGGCGNDCDGCGYYESSCGCPTACEPACCAPMTCAPTCCAPVCAAPACCAPSCCAPSTPSCCAPTCATPSGCNW